MTTGKKAMSKAGKELSARSPSKAVAGSALTQAQRNEKVSRALATANKSTGAFETKYAKR